ncbi:hypothetical protein N7491_006438 [Penicillium cf. griseofulvum]|uniref:Uncharacterized protein n=1 Tax=Penicillium cf. griseofulvum TaxID=2972120 RepID=A0A9W9IY34_9EURO|nr:hypothetical protein N7472_010531 [Penicillium cf. griseofulvum]KAJ5429422.1 hypothetical protein N7491_006438 [Penicillium cf. griseofulvum]KAJ5436795.1 hypothetical protein N7445_007680 [Penicillium cf. griseofulvum]
MHAKARPEPKPLVPLAASSDWRSVTQSTIDLNPTKMARKVVTTESHIHSESQVSKHDPTTSDLDKPGVEEDSYNASRRHCLSWIHQLKQGVADYEHFIQRVNLNPSTVYYTIVSAQAEYEKLQEQTMEKLNKALEAHRARAVVDASKAAEAEDAAWDALNMQYYRSAKGKNGDADRLRRPRLDEPTCAGSKVLASIEPADRGNPDKSTLSAESVAGAIEPRISKSTYIPDPERLDDGIGPQFESWLHDMQGKLFFNADHYSTEKHKMIYIACRTTGTAHVYLNAGLRKDAKTPYTTAQQMFDDLEWRFGNLNEAVEACDGLYIPNMESTDDFHTFLSMFLYKSGGNRISFGSLKNELFIRLTEDLKRAVKPAAFSENVTFDEFTKLCAHEAGLLGNGYSKNRKRGWRKGRKNTYRDNKESDNMPALPSSPAPGNGEWIGDSVSPSGDKWGDSVSAGDGEWPRESAWTEDSVWPKYSEWPEDSSWW